MGEPPPPQPPSPVPAKVYYDDCPGCAMDKKKETHKGVPYKELLFVGITSFASALPVTSLFPFLYFMAYSIEVCQPEQQALGISIHGEWVL
nr:unnamed protein product [Digitaria exilis]